MLDRQITAGEVRFDGQAQRQRVSARDTFDHAGRRGVDAGLPKHPLDRLLIEGSTWNERHPAEAGPFGRPLQRRRFSSPDDKPDVRAHRGTNE
jgi:hypothetical protein